MKSLPLMLTIFLLLACSSPHTPVEGRWYSQEQVNAGEPLYQAYCSSCHGADGSATAEWRTVDSAGNYPPPPLNGTAHTWHHPLAVLDATIVAGGAEFGGLMPGFGTVLAEEDRWAIIAWLQSLWSNEIYQRWQEIDKRSDD